MKRSSCSRVLILLLGLLGVFAASGATAQVTEASGFSYGLTAGATHSDNAGKTRASEESETSLGVGFFSNIKYERERLSAVLDADLRFESHSYGTYSDGLYGGLAARADYGLFRDRLVWVVEDNLGQTLIETRNTATLDNTQNLNVFATGPDVLVPIGPRTGISLQGRWTDVSYEESDYGNRRLSGAVGLVRRLGERSTVSVNASVKQVEYKELSESSDYKIKSALVAWDAIGSKSELSVFAGYSALEEEADSTDSATFGLDVSHQVSSRSRVSLHAGRGFGDSADNLQREQGIRGTSIGDRPASVSADPFTSDHATLRWDSRGAQSEVSTSVHWRRERHSRDEDLNRRAADFGLQVSRRLSERLSVRFQSGYLHEDFSNADIEFDEWNVGLGVGWRFTRSVSGSFSWGRFDADGDTIFGPGTRKYIENRYSVDVSWSPTP